MFNVHHQYHFIQTWAQKNIQRVFLWCVRNSNRGIGVDEEEKKYRPRDGAKDVGFRSALPEYIVRRVRPVLVCDNRRSINMGGGLKQYGVPFNRTADDEFIRPRYLLQSVQRAYLIYEPNIRPKSM